MLGLLRPVLGWTRSRSTDGYEPLPDPSTTRRPKKGYSTKVKILICSLPVLVIGAALLVYGLAYPSTWLSRLISWVYVPNPPPPLYPEFREAESKLPQHNVTDPFAGGQKYLFASSHTYWLGWGNYMQDMVLTAHLAYLTNRTHVFNDYIWDVDGHPFVRFASQKWIPNRIPLTALISGPIVGGDFPVNDTAPRAVSKLHFDKICPKRSIIHVADVRKAVEDSSSAMKLTEAYIDFINKLDDPCVEITASTGATTFIVHTFDSDYEGLMALWPSLKQNPMITLFGWSTLAQQAFETNRNLFAPAPLIQPYTTTDLSCPRCVERSPRLDGLLVLQIRRGDFRGHCRRLAGWHSDFNTFNRFDGFADPWVKPQLGLEERMPLYMQRCWPTVDQIVAKVAAVRRTEAGRGLGNVYVMTNGDERWLAELKHALWAEHPWERIATSRDLVWTWEQKFVSQTMDMLVAERAQVFVGNGFSSLASNIVMLRMAKGVPPEFTTMW